MFAQSIHTPLNRIIHASDSDLFDQSTAHQQQTEDLRIHESGVPIYSKLLIHREKNEDLVFEVFKVPLYDDNKRITGIMGAFYPNIMHSAQLSEIHFTARFRDIFKNLPTPVYIASYKTGLILEANNALLTLSGCDYEQVIGSTSIEIGLMSKELRANIMAQFKDKRVAQIPWENGIETKWPIKGELNFQRSTCNGQEFVIVSFLDFEQQELVQYKRDSHSAWAATKQTGVTD